MKIPEFLRPENRKINPEGTEMFRLCREYAKMFGDYPMTEPSSYSEQEWIEILEECIREKKTTWEVFGDEFDPEADY